MYYINSNNLSEYSKCKIFIHFLQVQISSIYSRNAFHVISVNDVLYYFLVFTLL